MARRKQQRKGERIAVSEARRGRSAHNQHSRAERSRDKPRDRGSRRGVRGHGAQPDRAADPRRPRSCRRAPMSDDIRIEPAKKVITYAHDGSENGWLIELSKDGRKTTAYLTAASSGSFKGYHLHRVRAARYVCVRGRMKII